MLGKVRSGVLPRCSRYFNISVRSYGKSGKLLDDSEEVLPSSELRKIIDISIECMILTENIEYLFSDIRSLFEAKLFWEQISKFIKKKKIVSYFI